MAIKGAQAKEEVTAKILEMFEGSFKHEKEIRVPVMENGELVQIKISLTAAKVNVEAGAAAEIPGTKEENMISSFPQPIATATKANISAPPDDEKARVAELLKKLNYN